MVSPRSAKGGGGAWARILRHLWTALHGPGIAGAGLLGIGVAILMLWAPLPFGSAVPWAAALLQVAILLLLAGAVLRASDLSPLAAVAIPAAALLALAAFALLQSMPLPQSVVGAVSPRHAAVHQQAGEILEAAGAEPPPATLSLAPSASRRTALDWATVAAALALGALAGRRPAARLWIGGAALATAAFEVLYGTRSWFSGSTVIWGVELGSTDRRLHGTFVNVDHLATYLLMALALAFAWAWWAIARARWEESLERRVWRVAPPLLVWALLFAGLVLTGSRAGVVAALCGTAVQGVLAAVASRRWRAAPAGVIAAAGAVALVSVLGLGQGFGRLESTSAFEVLWGARAQAYRAVLDLWREFPWLGSGAGTFREAFPLVQPAALGGTWHHAHSDVLEQLATTGVLGLAILTAAAVGIALPLTRILRRGRRSSSRAAAVAALGALAAVGAQELVDFGLTVPANGVLLAILCGAAAASSATARAASFRAAAPAPRRGAPGGPRG